MIQNFGSLFVVALPIGNPSDISDRAKSILNQVDLVAAEDTRVFQALAKNLCLNIKQCVSHHDHNETESAKELLSFLKAGKSIALVSDAGTPNISDPGFALVKGCFETGLRVIPVPGPSALTALLSISPIGGGKHFFAGFAPAKQPDRIKLFSSYKTLQEHTRCLVFYESPHRLLEHLEDAFACWGDRQVFIGREISKTYEEYLWLPLSKLLTHYQENQARGEFVLAYDLGPEFVAKGEEEIPLEEKITALLQQGMSSKEIQNLLAKKSKLSKKDLYKIIQNLKDST